MGLRAPNRDGWDRARPSVWPSRWWATRCGRWWRLWCRPTGRRTCEAGPRAGARPGLPDRDRVRAEDRDPVGVPAAGDGLRQRNDLLAPPAGLAARRRVGPAALGAPAAPGGRRPERP